MLARLPANKATMANWLFGLFALLLVLGAAISQFFQAPADNNIELSRYRNLIPEVELPQLSEITLKNRLGTFRFENIQDGNFSGWHLVSPRFFPASHEALLQIVGTLKKLAIKRIYEKDPININNFSLDSPLIEIAMTGKDGKRIKLDFGLINPIDSSTYVTLSDRKAIYHINAVETPIERMELASFIDSRVITRERSAIYGARLYRGEVRPHNLILELTKKNGEEWVGKNDLVLDTAAVNDILDEFLSLKSQIIIDRIPEGAKDLIERSFAQPIYTLEIDNFEGVKTTFNVTNILPAISDLKIEKSTNIAISASNRRYPFVLSKDFLKVFNISEQRLRKPPIKKLFY